jgi:hypothetical protein
LGVEKSRSALTILLRQRHVEGGASNSGACLPHVMDADEATQARRHDSLNEQSPKKKKGKKEREEINTLTLIQLLPK